MQVFTYPESKTYTLYNTFEHPVISLRVWGDSVQDGTPTPNAPIDIVSVGDDGNVSVTACGKNLFPWNDYTAAPFQPNTLTSWERTSDEISVVPDIAKPASGFCIWNSQVNKNFYACDGKTITLSCEVWAESETALRIGVENIKLQKFTVGNAWQKCSVTLDFMLSTSGKTIAWYANYSNVPFKVRNIQVEIGSVATDYEPYKGNTAEITTGLPLCSVGDVRDELGYNADGTGKIIKHIYKTVLNGSEEWKSGSTNTTGKQRIYLTIADETLKALYGSKYNPDTLSMIKCNQYISVTNNETYRCTKGISVNHIYGNAIAVYDENFATATLDEWKAHLAANPLTVIYVLNTPQEIELSAAETTEFMQLHTMDKITNVFNSDNAEMQITFLGGQEMETNIDGFWDSEDGDRKYSAADFVGFFQDFFTNGIVAESTTYLQVKAKEGLTVRVNVGKAYINGGFFKPKTVTDLTIEDSDTTNPRYDMVVLRWDATIKKIYLDIVKGTPAATPFVPALTRNEIVYELGLARIYVAANTLQITQANITDLRFNSAYCGVVKGVIDTIDTTDLFAQYDKAWIDFVAQLGESDQVVINTIDEQARADIGELQEDVEEHTATLKTNAPYKILTGSGTASGGSTSITFETAFKTVPVVIVAPYSTSTTAARACTCHLSAISATGFTVKTYTVTGATSANVENIGIGFRWVAYGT